MSFPLDQGEEIPMQWETPKKEAAIPMGYIEIANNYSIIVGSNIVIRSYPICPDFLHLLTTLSLYICAYIWNS